MLYPEINTGRGETLATRPKENNEVQIIKTDIALNQERPNLLKQNNIIQHWILDGQIVKATFRLNSRCAHCLVEINSSPAC